LESDGKLVSLRFEYLVEGFELMVQVVLDKLAAIHPDAFGPLTLFSIKHADDPR
jgi:hypothetical protein